jgi:hypothetical protein
MVSATTPPTDACFRPFPAPTNPPLPPPPKHRSHSLSHLLSEVTARAHTLSCQAAAAAAKAAGARGLQAGEDARARAAAAEAEGLRVSRVRRCCFRHLCVDCEVLP